MKLTGDFGPVNLPYLTGVLWGLKLLGAKESYALYTEFLGGTVG